MTQVALKDERQSQALVLKVYTEIFIFLCLFKSHLTLCVSGTFMLLFCLYHQIADYYYDERMCLLRCVLLLLTYFQDERHPFKVLVSCFVFASFAIV